MAGITTAMDEYQQLEADARELFDPARDIPDWYVDDEYDARVQAEIDAQHCDLMRLDDDPAMDAATPF